MQKFKVIKDLFGPYQVASVCFCSCTNVLWNARVMEPRFFKNYSRNPKKMLKKHNYIKKYLIYSQNSEMIWKLPRYIVTCLWIFSKILYKDKFLYEWTT